MSNDDSRSQLQLSAAEYAVDWVQSGMVLGLGSGSTAGYALRKLAKKLDGGRLSNIIGVPSSEATAALAKKLGVPVTTLDEHPRLDLTIDGADEVDGELNLIKGGGGALLREKMLAAASARVAIIVDESKLSQTLGVKHSLPVEVVEFGWRAQARYFKELGADVKLRRTADDQPFRTDNGNLVLDCRFGQLAELEHIAACLDARSGVVEHGLFLGLATDLVCAGAQGIRHWIGRAGSNAGDRS